MIIVRALADGRVQGLAGRNLRPYRSGYRAIARSAPPRLSRILGI